ncbi:stage III sporulation protein AF [Sulfobacillus sp. hq2]|nr:stage III sporulation protein AF [Sulfobacillus sp. hq2]MCY0908849.1 stage III sporulation protein AF [Sulfobacillus thermotolerans]
MIALIGHWVRSLIIIVLLGNLADFVLPKGDLKKYAGLVVGLVLLLAMVSPVWSLIHQVGKSPQPNAWIGAGTGQNLSSLVHAEQIDQAEAMVLSYKNVQACTISADTQGGYSAVVRVSGTTNTATLRQYIEDALAVTTGETPKVHLIVQSDQPKHSITRYRVEP